MKKKHLVIIAILLVIICMVYIIAAGGTLTAELDLFTYNDLDPEKLVFVPDYGGIAEVTDVRSDGETLYITFRALSRGKDHFVISGPNDFGRVVTVYSHAFGVLTYDNFFGRVNGGWIIRAAVLVYIAVLLYYLIKRYRDEMRLDMYRYKNILLLGLIIFLVFLAVDQIFFSFDYRGLYDAAYSLTKSTGAFAFFLIPVAIVIAVLVTISHIRLMRREGRTWRNMLGLLLSIVFILVPFIPSFNYEILRRMNGNFFNQSTFWPFALDAMDTTVYTLVAYLECLLIATIIVAVKAARYVPSFDKDYMLILGSRINDDGSLTNLLKGRADRALEFAGLQKEATGKDLVFVPSGGQGSDEVMPEAQAIKNYLLQQGVPEDRILVEDKSANTEENLKNSAELIRAAGAEDPKIAFSTTNYHVFRSGMLASSQGIRAAGIGSRTKRYFWVNAFIREFIGTLYAERRRHIRIVVLMVVIIFLLALVLFYGYNL